MQFHGNVHIDLSELSEADQETLLETLKILFDGHTCHFDLMHRRVNITNGSFLSPRFRLITTKKGTLRGVEMSDKFTTFKFRPRHVQNRTVVNLNHGGGYADFEIWPAKGRLNQTTWLAKLHISRKD